MVVYLIHFAALSAAVFTEVKPQPGCMPNDICCAGGYNHLGKCKTLTECASEGQMVWKAGNETQDNRCWCDGLYGYAPQRPRECRETNDPDACHCMSCSDGEYPNVKENGKYVDNFDKTKHCVSRCSLPPGSNITTSMPMSDNAPGTCNCQDLKSLVIGNILGMVILFIVGLCIVFRREIKSRFSSRRRTMNCQQNLHGTPESELLAGVHREGDPLADVHRGGEPLAEVHQGGEPLAEVHQGGEPLAEVHQGESHEDTLRQERESHENELRIARESYTNALAKEKEHARNVVISMGTFVLDETLITSFENGGFLSKEDTEKWIKDTFKDLPTNLRRLPEEKGQEEDLMLRDLEASKKGDDWFPLGKSMRCITKQDVQYIIRETAIDVLKGVLRCKPIVPDRATLLKCLVNSGYDGLVYSLQGNGRGQANKQVAPINMYPFSQLVAY